MSGLKLSVISLTRFITAFFTFITSPLLPVLRLSFTNDWQLTSWVWTTSTSSFCAARFFSFISVCWSIWLNSSIFLLSIKSWSSCACFCTAALFVSWWSFSSVDRKSISSRDLLTTLSWLSIGLTDSVISALCASKVSTTRSYWWSLCFLTVQLWQMSSSHVSQ